MADRIIELTWTCADCGNTPILGRHKTCPTCGSPREKGEMKMRGLENTQAQASVTDPKLLDLARAGHDWFCTHCSAGNRGDGARCEKCGAPRYGDAEELHPELAPRVAVPSGPPRSAQRHAAPSPSTTIYAPASEDDDAPLYVPPRFWTPRKLAAAAALGLLLVFIGWALTTHDVPGQVTARSWTRTVHIERWTQTTERLWKHKTWERAEVAPVDGHGEVAGLTLTGNCRSEHYDDERYVCGSHSVCHDVTRSERYACGESCRSTGNGFASCSTKYCSRSVFVRKDCHDEPTYCTRPIYKDRCDYQTQVWRPLADYPASGVGDSTPAWASAPMAPLTRPVYSTTHAITWIYDDRGATKTHVERFDVSHSDRAACEAAGKLYAAWPLAAQGILAVRNLGGVARVRPLEVK